MSSTVACQAQQSQPEEPALFHQVGSARYLTLNRPRVLNAMNIDMVEAFFPMLQAWEKSDAAKMIFLKGNGRALCSGGDVKAFLELLKRKDPKIHYILDLDYKMFHYIATMKTPYIALMDGITMGAGAGLSVNSAFRIATENTVFAMPETTIGLFPDVGASFFLSRLDGRIGTYLGMTGHTIKSHDVLQSGIATHFVPSAHLPALQSRLISLDTSDHDTINDTINAFTTEHVTRQDSKDQHFTLRGDIRQTIDKCFQYNTAEEIVDALEKDGSNFAKAARDTILKRPPTSVKVTLQHIRLGINMGIKDCFKMEYALWQKFAVRHDFSEGVISQLVTKQPPQWQPARLSDVNDDEMRHTFFDTPASHEIELLNDDTYLTSPYRRYALPSESDILNTLTENPTWQQQDLTRHYMDMSHGKFGIAEKVADIWERNNGSVTAI
ncbi:unnamed protein product [Absidia cylindrospora]